MTKLSQEVAEAAIVLSNDLPHATIAPKHGDELVRIARKLTRLEARRRKVNAELKRLDGDLKIARRELKALASYVRKGE